MEENQILLSRKILSLIYDKINSSTDLIKGNGILEGKIGMVLFLYNYARLMHSKKVQKDADFLLDEIWESVHRSSLTNSFYSGHLGVAWALSELGKHSFLDIDDTINSYFELIDFYVLRDQKTKIPILIDIESGLFVSGIYLLSRCTLSDLGLDINYYWRENAIYLIEDSERILYRRTGCNNVFLPELTLSLLNSILYFLIKVHKQKIYPYKTNVLIKYLYEQIKQLINQSNIQDIIVSQCLLLTISDEISYGDADLIDEHIYQSKIQGESMLDMLAALGLYTLLYDDKSIFEKVYSIIQNDIEYLKLVYHKLTSHKQISGRTLFGLGYIFLNIINEKE